MMNNTNFQTFYQMGNAINDVVRQATGRDNVQNIDMDYVTVAQNKRLVEKVITGDVASFYTPAPTILDHLIAQINPVQSGTGDPSPENIRPISGWTGAQIVVSPTTDAEDGQTYPITFPSEAGTVYGGTLTVNKDGSGELMVDMAMVEYDGSNDEQWSEYGTGSNYYCCVISQKGKKLGYQKSICNEYKNTNNAYGLADYGIYSDHPNLKSTYFRMPNADVHTKSEFLAWIAQHPIQLVYELNTPVTYTLTAEQIETLAGENNIFADTGNVTVMYSCYEEVV